MDDTFEFASPEWMAEIRTRLDGTVRGLDFGGRSFTVSEEFTDPPPHLLPDGAKSIAWHFRVTDGAVEVGDGPLAGADLETTVDYDTCLPIARLIYDTPEALEELQVRRAEASDAGKLTRKGDESALPPELMQRLFDLHNEMARRTR
jgi:hypothetical protein